MAKLAILGGPKAAPDGLRSKWPEQGSEEREALLRALERSSWCRIMLPEDESDVAGFEREWAEFLGRKHAVAVGNGTIALQCALWALGVGPGDEVIVPAVTFAATGTAVCLVRATPVFVDVDPQTYQISPRAIRAAISSRTRAIIAVHYGGYPCDMDSLAEISEQSGIPVLEDAAHAHGSEWRGRKVGGLNSLGAFSFQHGKSLTSGEGGAVTTDNEELWKKVSAFHNVGRVPGGSGVPAQVMCGNFRMVEFCGAVLRQQLKRLPEQNERRQASARLLSERLRQIGGLEPLPEDERITGRGYYFFVMRYNAEQFGGVHRNMFLKAMAAEGAGLGTGYQEPIYLLGAFGDVPRRLTDCPVSERICEGEQVTLFNHYLLDRQNAEAVAAAVEKLAANVDELRKAADLA